MSVYGASWGMNGMETIWPPKTLLLLWTLPGAIRQTLCWEALAVLAEAATLANFND